MNLENDIREEFFLTTENTVSDDFIKNNTDILWIKEDINYMEDTSKYRQNCQTSVYKLSAQSEN